MTYSNSTIYSSLTHDRGSCDNGEVLLSAWKEMRIKFWVKKNWGGIHFPRVPGFWLIPMYDVPWSKHGVWTIGIQPWNRESSYWPLCLNGFHGSWCVTLIQFISNYVFMNIPWDPHIWQQQKNLRNVWCWFHHGTAERPGGAWNEACFSSCGFLLSVFRPPLGVPWDTGDESLKGGVAWCGYGSKFGWPKQLA